MESNYIIYFFCIFIITTLFILGGRAAGRTDQGNVESFKSKGRWYERTNDCSKLSEISDCHDISGESDCENYYMPCKNLTPYHNQWGGNQGRGCYGNKAKRGNNYEGGGGKYYAQCNWDKSHGRCTTKHKGADASDSDGPDQTDHIGKDNQGRVGGQHQCTVSYTHLTLPTKA